MCAQAAEFFVNVRFLDKQRKFLLQTVVVDIADRFRQARVHLVHMRLKQAGEQLAQRIHDFFHACQALQQMFAEFFTFAFAGGSKFFQRLIQQLLYDFRQSLRIFALTCQYPRKAQHFSDRQLAETVFLAPSFVQVGKLFHQLFIGFQTLPADRRVLQLNAAFQFAACG